MPRKLIDITNKRFGKLIVVSPSYDYKWLCKCDCGKYKDIAKSSLINGSTKSCGCLLKEIVSITSKKHGLSAIPEYYVWQSLLARCYNKNNKSYHRYGGRGIFVCDEWRYKNGFENFYKDLGNRPSNTHSLERKDNNDSYCKNNCIWATKKEQARNRSTNLIFTINGETKILKEWCEFKKIKYKKVWKRIKLGWSIEDALS